MKMTSMLRCLSIALLMLACGSAFAAPFIVSDPDPLNADICVYQVQAQTPTENPPPVVTQTVAGACRIDTAPFSPGLTPLRIWFRYTAWGGAVSASAPFVLGKPGANGPAPGNLRLQP